MLALAAATTFATWEARRAERRFADVRHLANVSLLEIEGAMHNVAGATKARLLTVRTAEEYLEQLSKEAKGDPGLTRELAGAYEKLGDVLGNPDAGNVGDAADAADRYRQAEALLLSLHADADGSSLDAMSLAGILNKLTEVESRTADEAGSRRDSDVAVALTSRIAQSRPQDSRAGHLLASATIDKARLEMRSKGFPAGERDMQTALAIETNLAESSHSRDDRISLAMAYRQAATLLEQMHDYDRALEMCSRTAVLYGQLAAEDPSDSDLRRNRMIALTTAGSIQGELADKGQIGYPVAISTQRQAWAMASDAAAADPENAEALSDMSAVAIRLAHTLADAHRYREALPLLDRAIGASSELVERDPTNRDYRTTLAFGYGYLGYVQGLQGHLTRAVSDREKAAATYQQLAVETPGDTRILEYEVWNWLGLGKMLAGERNYAAARSIFHKALETSDLAGPAAPQFQGYVKDLNEADRRAGAAMQLVDR